MTVKNILIILLWLLIGEFVAQIRKNSLLESGFSFSGGLGECYYTYYKSRPFYGYQGYQYGYQILNTPSVARVATKVHQCGNSNNPILLKSNGDQHIITSPGFPESYSKNGQ